MTPSPAIRIAFDASVVRGHRTGVENYALRLLEALRAVPGGPEVIPFSNQSIEGVPGVAVHPSRLPLPLWRQLVLPGLVRRAGATSLHSPVTAIPLRLSVPAIATVHDLGYLVVPDCYSAKERMLQRLWLRLARARAAAIVCVSETTRSAIIAHFPKVSGKLCTIHNGAIALPAPLGGAIHKNEIPPSLDACGLRTPFVLCAGRIERRKNPVRTLTAFLAATAAAPELQNHMLVFAGKMGNAAKEISAAVARHPETAGRVLFPGYIDETELFQLYAASEALLYLSLDEGFGHPPLEALALGTPVVASDIPVLREVLGEAAEFAPPEQVPAMTAAIRNALTNPARRAAILASGRERLAQLTWQAAAEQIIALHAGLQIST